MTAVVLAHPSERRPPFRVFGVYDGEDDRFVFGVRNFDDREKAERCARQMIEFYQADYSQRCVG